MARQKKILDLTEGRTRIQCVCTDEQCNPYHVYLVISVAGDSLRRRQLIRYQDFMSVLYFIIEFFRDGLDALPYCDMMELIRSRSV